MVNPGYCLSILLFVPLLLKGDSLTTRKVFVHADAGGSYAVERDAWDEERKSLLLKALVEYRHRKFPAKGIAHDYWFFGQIGYTALQDSVWIKSSDVLKAQMRWISGKGSELKQTGSVLFQTQCLNSYRNTEGRAKWNGGFMNPFKLELSYGFSKSFLNNSSFQITPAGLLFQTAPNLHASTSIFNDDPLIKGHNTELFVRYGCSAMLLMDEQFYNGVLTLRHQSRFFFNAISSRNLQLELNNRLCIRFLKYMQLRIETMLVYDPEQSLRLQYRQDILLGVFYEHRK